MKEFGFKAENASIAGLGLEKVAVAHWNLEVSDLVERSVKSGDGKITDTGALAVNTGKFTGRSPKDKSIVYDEKTKDSVWWGDINAKFDKDKFDVVYNNVCKYLEEKEVYVRDSYACADPEHRLNIRVVTEFPWSNLFANNLFLRPTKDEILSFDPEWTIICAPGYEANPEVDGTRQGNFTILNMTKKILLIGGSAYTGEIKKGIFSLLNYILPHEKNVLSMHCSANIGKDGDTAIFFGLSGTGKTTLSADANRGLIGDDEHGWSDKGVFNFEGGCYAKCVDLSAEKEPEIFAAVKPGALLENIDYIDGTDTVDYFSTSITENTRVSYPIDHIENSVEPSVGNIPKNIFLLTCDAFGVLPPISKLTPGQAMYHFISGYTAKVAGTEMGITEPTTTFSACFGKVFLPLHPTKYAELLGKKLKENDVNVWLVNTGWSGGSYGVGSRMKLKYTRAMITSVLTGKFDNAEFEVSPVFKLNMPTACEGVPSEILNPRKVWEDKAAFDETANKLADEFNKNFKEYADAASDEMIAAAPISVTA
jgi:phosphoenolpyruvate carboxykinase (ATP)